MRSRRDGMVLLEVMLGIAILSMAGVAIITLLTQTMQTVRHGRLAERQAMSAASLLDRATLWSSTELSQRVGRQRIGSWNLEIDVPQAQLFTLAVRDTLTGATVLRTTVYRPAQSSDP